jgi:hypothetical protein
MSQTRHKETRGSQQKSVAIQSPRQRARAASVGFRGRATWPSSDLSPDRIWSAPRSADRRAWCHAGETKTRPKEGQGPGWLSFPLEPSGSKVRPPKMRSLAGTPSNAIASSIISTTRSTLRSACGNAPAFLIVRGSSFYGIFLRKRPATNAAIYSKFVSDFANPDLFYSDEQRFTTCGACSRNCTQHNRSWQWPQLMVTNIWSSSIVAYLLICKRRSPYGVLFGRRSS